MKQTEPQAIPDRLVGWWSQVFAYVYATHFLFGSVSVLNALGLNFTFYYSRIVNIVLIDPMIDMVVWAVSVACLSVLTIWSSKGVRERPVLIGLALLAMAMSAATLATFLGEFPNSAVVYSLFAVATTVFFALFVLQKQFRGMIARVLIYLFTLVAVIEISSATHYVVRAFDPTTQIGRWDAGIELQLSYASYGLLPWLYVGFLFSWAWVPLVHRFLSHSKFIHNEVKADSAKQHSLLPEVPSGNRLSTLLDPKFPLALALAVLVGYYPYLHNPPWLVGTDAYWRYYDPLSRMNAIGNLGGFTLVPSTWHPVALAIMYSIQLLSRTTTLQVVLFTPLFLVVTLPLSMWWFLASKKPTGFGLVVFAFSIMSVTTTVGFYSSILANWMALLVWTIFFAYLAFRVDDGFRITDAAVLLVLSTLILFIHPWTWGVFAASVLVAAFATLFAEKRKGLRGAATLISIVVIDSVLALVSLTLLKASQGQGVADALRLYTLVMHDPSSLLLFWDAVTRLTQVWTPFFSPLYIAASIIGVFLLGATDLTPWRRRLILAWLFASAVGSILVAPIGFDPVHPASSESQLWRLFFLTPFQFTAPFGIAWLTQFPYRFQRTDPNAEEPTTALKSYHGIWIGILFALGAALPFAPASVRLLLLLVLLPVATGLLLVKAGNNDKKFLRSILLVTFLLVAFNNTARSLSQLLIDPHNYRPKS